MRVAVLCRADSWYLADLRRAAGDRAEVFPVAFESLTSEVTTGQVAACPQLASADAVLVRTMPAGSLEQVVFRMDVLARLEAAGTLVLNPPKAVEAAVDKYLTTARLAAAGLLVPPTIVCQGMPAGMEAFARLGGDCVIKPLFGGEGRGIARVTDPAIAERTFSLLASLGAVLYVQQFVPHEGFDFRLFVLGGNVWAMRRTHPTDWRTNVSRGAVATAHTATPEQIDLARRAADAVGAPLAGVDLLPGRDGRLYVLEVNAAPGWRALASATGADIASEVLAHLSAGCGVRHG